MRHNPLISLSPELIEAERQILAQRLAGIDVNQRLNLFQRLLSCFRGCKGLYLRYQKQGGQQNAEQQRNESGEQHV